MGENPRPDGERKQIDDFCSSTAEKMRAEDAIRSLFQQRLVTGGRFANPS